ncbi:SEC-C motif-containing protein [Stigmatella aurantiaca]|uniref:SEC-C motif-containing protein n=1 Tax=Stigmatella aurantiaca TaxID=41 RepID=A0A1H7XAP7_STIAU|nr:YchJ family metal-binding protein [Stigmatella aurantiaca]SEM30267.1 SEC-C motif-containing protein [Stigmatella aurantiaca]
MPPAPPCPCSSGLRYRQCCAPYHRGQAEPPDAEALMRSRYSAFALREVAYLWRTLHPEHPDRARPEADMLRELRTSAQSHQYPGLAVLDRRPPDAQGVAQVLFFAKVFERGKDRSFVERSDFRHDGTGWRYVSGHLLQLRELPCPPEQLTLATFPS